MNELQIMPFATQTVDVRVVNSQIGPVAPVVDIAKAIGYERGKLHEILDRYPEQFEGTVVPVTVTSVFSQTSSKGKEFTRESDQEVRALNAYGVVGLLMKLDYNRIKDARKKALVLRFQRWAMRVLGEQLKMNNQKRTAMRYERHIDSVPPAPEGVITMTVQQAAKELGITETGIKKRIRSGSMYAYRERTYYGSRYAIPVHEVRGAHHG